MLNDGLDEVKWMIKLSVFLPKTKIEGKIS